MKPLLSMSPNYENTVGKLKSLFSIEIPLSDEGWWREGSSIISCLRTYLFLNVIQGNLRDPGEGQSSCCFSEKQLQDL